MTNDAPKLLPCPFCGGEKMLITTNEFCGFCLTCESCDAVGPPSEYQPAKMRQAWNTRADHAQAELQAAVVSAANAAVDAERIACANMAYEYLTHSSNPMREELAEMIYERAAQQDKENNDE